MRKFAKLAAPALAAIAALGTIAPASAQDWSGRYEHGYQDNDRGDYRGNSDDNGNWDRGYRGQRGGGWGDRGQYRALSRQIDQLEQFGYQQGGRDGRYIRQRVYTLRNALNDWSRDGLSDHEVRTMRGQISLTYQRVGNGYGDRGGYGRGW